MFHNGTPTFSKQGFSPGFWTQCIHTHAYGHTYVCMKYSCTKLVHSSSVSCVSLHSQHCPEVDPSKNHLQLGEQCQLLHWKPHHCHSLCPTYWHGRCWNSDGQRVRKAAGAPWSSHWSCVKPSHSLLPLKLISSIQTSSLERMYFSLFIYWKTERPHSQWDHMLIY